MVNQSASPGVTVVLTNVIKRHVCFFFLYTLMTKYRILLYPTVGNSVFE